MVLGHDSVEPNATHATDLISDNLMSTGSGCGLRDRCPHQAKVVVLLELLKIISVHTRSIPTFDDLRQTVGTCAP